MIVVSRFLVSTVRLNRLWILLCPRIDETCRHFHSGFNNSIVIQYIFIRVRAWKKLKREREKIDKNAWINVRFVHLIRVINIYFCFFLFFFFNCRRWCTSALSSSKNYYIPIKLDHVATKKGKVFFIRSRW